MEKAMKRGTTGEVENMHIKIEENAKKSFKLELTSLRALL